MDKKELEKKILENTGVKAKVIEKDDKFEFKCKACGECCSNSTLDSIILSPLDIYNIAKELKISASNVIKEYTRISIGRDSKFPVIRLKEVVNLEKTMIAKERYTECPFLVSGRCRVHNSKPSVCKLYPLGRTGTIDMTTKETKMNYFIIENVSCGGKGEKHSIDNWVKNKEDDEKMITNTGEFVGDEFAKLFDNEMIKKILDSNNSASDSFYNIVIDVYYGMYDTTRDFWEQYNDNLGTLRNIFKDFVNLLT